MTDIRVDDEDKRDNPTNPAGQIDRAWVSRHLVTSAKVDGVFCDVTAASTIAALRPDFLSVATGLGLPDFDASAIKLARPRELTQRVASHIYELFAANGEFFSGVRFASRHGDDLVLWAIFERARDETSPFSRRLEIQTEDEFAVADPELSAALLLHGLTWPPRS